MTQRRKAIGTTSIALGVIAVIIVAAVGVLVATNQVNPGGPSETSNLSSAPGSASTATTMQFLTTVLQPTEVLPNNFSVSGRIPYLVVSPQNDTFLLTYDVTSYNYILNLSYEQFNSYSVQYSNGTQWLSTSRACPTTASSSTTTVGTVPSNATVVTTTVIPCGRQNAEWYPVNGEPIANVQNINDSSIQVSVQPTSVPAHTTQEVRVTVSIEMHPGVYAINLGMGIRAQGSSGPVLYLLGYTPVIVQG